MYKQMTFLKCYLLITFLIPRIGFCGNKHLNYGYKIKKMAYKLMYNIINIIILPLCMIMIIMMMISDDDHNYAKKVKVTYMYM